MKPKAIMAAISEKSTMGSFIEVPWSRLCAQHVYRILHSSTKELEVQSIFKGGGKHLRAQKAQEEVKSFIR